MTPRAFVQECERRSIRLFVKDGRVESAAPSGVSPEVIAVIDSYHADILAELQARAAPTPPETWQRAPQEKFSPEVFEPYRPLDLFDDADLLPFAVAAADHPGWIESRVGNQLVILCVDSASFGFTSQGLPVYRLAEVAALRAVGISADGAALQQYHALRCELLRGWEIRSNTRTRIHDLGYSYSKTGPLAEVGEYTWGGEVKRVQRVYSQFTADKAEKLLGILVAGGWLEIVETTQFAQPATIIRRKCPVSLKESLSGQSEGKQGHTGMDTDTEDPFGSEVG